MDVKKHSALYLRGDPYESSDAVFGVKESLIVDLQNVADFPGMAERYGVSNETKLLMKDFVLITEEEALAARGREAQKAVNLQKDKVKVVDGALVSAIE